MQVTLIRHGQTAGNVLHRYIGRTDEPLSEEGAALAAAKGSDPELQTVYVTPLRRTQQTAAILFPSARQIIVDDLREMDFGDFEGRSFSEMEHDTAYRAWVEGGCLESCPNGEGRAEFSQRVCAAFANLVADAAARGEESVTFVVHGGTIMAIMERFARPCKDYYSYAVQNCNGYCCRVCREEADAIVLKDPVLWDGVKHSCENPV